MDDPGQPVGYMERTRLYYRALGYQALDLLETATAARTTVTAPFTWNGNPDWRGVYNRVTPENAEYLRQKGDERRRRMAAKEQIKE